MALTSTRLSPWITRITFALALSGCGKPTSVSSSTESGATNPPTVSSTLGTTTITATGASAQSNSPVAGIVVAGATFATVGISMTSAHPRVIAGVCTRISLSISATLGDGSVGVFSVPVPITLAATHGHFYPSSKCTGTAITTVTVPAGES